jgi:hypothetical protein
MDTDPLEYMQQVWYVYGTAVFQIHICLGRIRIRAPSELRLSKWKFVENIY